jgi:hypothetical protein
MCKASSAFSLSRSSALPEFPFSLSVSLCLCGKGSNSFAQLLPDLGKGLVGVKGDVVFAAIFRQRMFGEDLIGGRGGLSVGEPIANEDCVLSMCARLTQSLGLVVAISGRIAEMALPAALRVRF